jgi:hypothetical protein
LYSSIRNGIPGTEMAPVRITDDEVWKIVGYVKRLGSQGNLEKAPATPRRDGPCIRRWAAVLPPNRSGTAEISARAHRHRPPPRVDVSHESLVKPDADIPINYRGVQVVLKSGQTVTASG